MKSRFFNPFQFQIRDEEQPPAMAGDDGDDIARVVIRPQSGRIAFANQAFRSLAGMPSAGTLQRRTSSAKRKTDDIADSFFRLVDGTTIDQVQGGTHKVWVGHDGADIMLDFHFDWVEMPSGEKLLIASEIDDSQAYKVQSNQSFFEEKIQGNPQLFSALENKAHSNESDALGSLEQESDLRHFLNMSNEIMIVADEHGDLIRVNASFHRLMEYSDQDIKALNLMDLFEETERPSLRNTLQALTVHDVHNTDIVDFEAQSLSKSGESLWMEWRLQHSGEFIYCVGRDLSAIKRHEQALDKRERELMEAEIIGRMGHWRWAVGRDGIEWSDQIFRIFGVNRKNFKPTIDSLNQMVHRRDVGRVVQAFQRAIIEQNDYDMEFRIVRPGGDIRYIRCEGRCEKDADGDVIALFGIMQDMTERTLYERELREAKDAAERAYAAKSQFLANMSHELRTPLNAIIGFSEMIQRQLLGPIGTEKYLDYINGIRESGEHLLDLISDILDMSKIEAGKYELDLEEVNVTKTIKLAVHMMEGRAHESGIRILTDALTNEDLTIIADRRAFMQIILNLLSNAVKFSNNDGRVWIECLERPEHISIKIRDEGIGIPANKLHCILRPFEQASASYSRNHEGSGLGLAITKELVELHQGSLVVESAIHEGTTVTVRIPYKAPQR
ncbi:MAG: ATP-binding protein [Alphaproteobacteria bacterium]